ncbi:GNAT family N-acetyltransferase [Roseibium aestuarii]|uniref:GNAT family N-acetyltransferase n=1 Tax=Roseibium aestuarii TaxID=2600299 RepID=A0ABW4JUZ9_9HYPH|nr:GNAT family N-acetyltransferase [Roseibium aestuarii]
MSLAPIRTERLELRPVGVSDLDRIATLCGNRAVARMLLRVPHPYDREAGRDYLEWCEAEALAWPASDEVAFAIDHEGLLIGVVSIRDLQKVPVIGYWLGEPYWNRGFMSEAVRAALSWLFARTSHQDVRSAALIENIGSLNVLKKNGFRQTGHGRAMSLILGRIVEDVHLQLTRQDFEAARSE